MTEREVKINIVALIASQEYANSENKNGEAMRDVVVRSWALAELIFEIEKAR